MEITVEIVCQDIMLLLARFKQEFSRIANEHGLTQGQLTTLYMVEQHNELAMGKVACELHCDPSNVTGMVDRLASRGLVTRQESPSDRRTKTIILTPEGHKIVRDMTRILPERVGCDRLSVSERQTLHAALRKVS